MNPQNLESFLDRLHRDPSFELRVKGAVLESLARVELGQEESELLFAEGLARVELASIRRANMNGLGVPPPPPPPPPGRPHKPGKPKKAPPKRPGKPKKAPPKKKPGKPKKKGK